MEPNKDGLMGYMLANESLPICFLFQRHLAVLHEYEVTGPEPCGVDRSLRLYEVPGIRTEAEVLPETTTAWRSGAQYSRHGADSSRCPEL